LILLVSTDGGRSFSSTANAHGDFHTVWNRFLPNPNLVYAGDDGGFWSSVDVRQRRWNARPIKPAGFLQFYHGSTDDADPYHVFRPACRITASGWG